MRADDHRDAMSHLYSQAEAWRRSLVTERVAICGKLAKKITGHGIEMTYEEREA